MNEDFFKILSRFADAGTRLDAANELAKLLEAEEIFCFLFNPVVNIFSAAPGFPGVLINDKEWLPFLNECKRQPCFRDSIILPGDSKKDAVGISSGDGCVLVLINCKYDNIIFSRLQAIFVLIAALMKMETVCHEIEHKNSIAAQSFRRAERLEKKLHNVRAKLQLALRTEDEFLSAASHELKTPVTSINAFVQVLQNSYPETSKETQTHYIVTRIKFQVDRLIRLMGNLFDATKMRSGKLKLNVGEVSLDKVVDDFIRHYSFTNITHKIIKNGSAVGNVRCDKDRIEQVISRLLDNAIRYSPAAGSIIITIGMDINHVLFSVQDFGIGIDAGVKNKIFDRLLKTHGEDSGNLSSLGLGLYIAADIIKRHNGNIWVDSEPGKGSTFHFSLPNNT